MTTAMVEPSAGGGGIACEFRELHGANAYSAQSVLVVRVASGGADRLARSFDDGWSKLLNGRKFEYEFHAGAAGQVGYELFASRRDADGYNLLFGNMGPEMIMYALRSVRNRKPSR